MTRGLDPAPGTTLTLYSSANEEEGCIGSVVIPTRDHVNAATMTSLLHTDWSWVPFGTYVERNIVQGGILTLQRNEAAQRMKGDWLLFIDDDMAWQPDAIGRLVAARDEIDADIIGGLCFRRSSPHQPTLYMRESPTAGAYNFLEDWTDDIVEVDATGMAFALIHKRVFEAIAATPMPPYAVRAHGNPPNFFRWEGVLGEDLRFCQDAKAAGMRIFVDTRIEIRHIAEIEISRRHFLMELAGRDPETEATRKEVNDAMGFPTLTRGEALRRLGWT